MATADGQVGRSCAQTGRSPKNATNSECAQPGRCSCWHPGRWQWSWMARSVRRWNALQLQVLGVQITLVANVVSTLPPFKPRCVQAGYIHTSQLKYAPWRHERQVAVQLLPLKTGLIQRYSQRQFDIQESQLDKTTHY